jgi:hypothetical protein
VESGSLIWTGNIVRNQYSQSFFERPKMATFLLLTESGTEEDVIVNIENIEVVKNLGE